LIRASQPTKTVGDYSSPNGPLPISPKLANIKLDQLVNYTSGLPQDNGNGPFPAPPLSPQPYSMPAMMSFLNASPPPVSPPSENYTYSNLAFAIVSAIIASGETNCNPMVGAFVSKIREHIFQPLGLGATFFDEVSLAKLPLGLHYDYWHDLTDDSTSGLNRTVA
jgi:CubicO group peptidase (beta-lactamase class C family)